jgi:hypothetical protein
VNCERCGQEEAHDHEIHYSRRHEAWVCFLCYQRKSSLINELRFEILASPVPRSRASLARAVGRTQADRSVGRALVKLVDDGKVHSDERGYRANAVRHDAEPSSKAAIS